MTVRIAATSKIEDMIFLQFVKEFVTFTQTISEIRKQVAYLMESTLLVENRLNTIERRLDDGRYKIEEGEEIPGTTG